MAKTGFIVKNVSKGREYFYLRKSIRVKNNVVNKKNLFSFGSRKKAIENLNEWKNDISKMPNELKKLGYDLEDIDNWINQIESK